VAPTRNRKVTLRKPLARAIRGGHPWIYADALRSLDGASPGEIVDVLDVKGGGFLARGYADPGSAIAVRVLTLDPDEIVDEAFVARRVAEASRLREAVVDRATTDAFRLLHGEGDHLPGLVCDVYAGVHVVRFDGEGARQLGRRTLLPALAGARTIYERWREGGERLSGEPLPEELIVREHGMRFSVDVARGQKTGFFLDQRENRRLLAGHARGRTLLNCFAYTGGFTIAGALGGATRTVSVDTAGPALDAARRNLELNELDPAQHALVCEDAFKFLERAARRGERWDIVVLDPPSFAPSADALDRALGAYRELNELGLRCVVAGGLLATASCSSHVTPEAFLGVIASAAARARRRVRFFELRGAGPDHPVAPGHPEGRYLEFFLGRVE
jgi:23S rRNA (cytosine1962-C5)-methyltransferase